MKNKEIKKFLHQPISSKKISINGLNIVIPRKHKLDEIYKNQPTYQFEPWKFIITKSKRFGNDLTLIDIGANVGDSAAHYRSLSKGKIISIEAHKKFFKYLIKNSKNIKNIELINALVVPNVDEVYYLKTNNTTGYLSLNEEGKVYTGNKININELLKNSYDEFLLIKSDLDGSDIFILKALLEMLEINRIKLALYYCEGPTEKQILQNQWILFYEELIKFFKFAYRVHIFTNHGKFILSSNNESEIYQQFSMLQKELKTNESEVQYLDFILEKI